VLSLASGASGRSSSARNAFMSAAWLAARSDCILTAPSRLMRLLAEPLGLVSFSPPVDLPEIKIAQVWHGRSREDPARRWFRELVRKSLG
jgi:DNA-binding transcriptional LysR family regulator